MRRDLVAQERERGYTAMPEHLRPVVGKEGHPVAQNGWVASLAQKSGPQDFRHAGNAEYRDGSVSKFTGGTHKGKPSDSPATLL